jgi:hypothetical protein
LWAFFNLSRNLFGMPPITNTSTLSPAELNALAARLDSAAKEFSDHTCNDYPLPANAANKAIAIAALKYIESTGDDEQDWEEFATDVEAAEDEIEFFDTWLMAYLAQRCKQAASGNGATGLSKAEGDVISGLLDHAAE